MICELTRRDVAKALGGLGLATLGYGSIARADEGGGFLAEGYGPLLPDPDRLIDLPKDFSYRVISRFGNIMDDGLPVPDNADGMGAFDLGDGKVALIRNHEIKAGRGLTPPEHSDGRFPPFPFYDRNQKGLVLEGGTSTMIYDMKKGEVVRQYMSLAGTIRNCSGGVTPWGSWLTCEEDVTAAGDGVSRDHGYIFEVPASPGALGNPEPLSAMGRFKHEAAAVDPDSGIVYMTEDRDNSLFYRFIPNERGNLSAGGRLQALSLYVKDSRNWKNRDMQVGLWMSDHWIDLDNPESPKDDLRERGAALGATVFARGEGIVAGKGMFGPEFFFTATSGGAKKHGQIFRYAPHRKVGGDAAARTFQLYFESPAKSVFNYGDNLTIMANGDLLVCEDGYEMVVDNHLRGLTGAGKVYAFARLRTQTEPAGVCFSPDGSTLFVNLYSPTMTLAITGPWESRKI